MAQRATQQRIMSVEEYLEFERSSQVKHEYVGGHPYAMVGVSRRHSRISLNIARKLANAAEGSPCRVHQSDMQVPVPEGPYYYPDVVVACGPEPEDPYIEDEPCLIVEVLSPNTETIDRREKLLAYRSMPSLMAYLIVEQERAMVEQHFRDEHGSWQAEVVDDGRIPVPCPPEAELSLAAVYEGP